MHSFKVVQIKETDDVEPVPHQWEENGVLYWPPSKSETRRHQSNAESVPDVNWLKYSCVVKQQGILIYSHASAAADQLCFLSKDEDIGSDKRRKVGLNYQKKSTQSYATYFPSDNVVKKQITPRTTLKPCTSRRIEVQEEIITHKIAQTESEQTNTNTEVQIIPEMVNENVALDSNLCSLVSNDDICKLMNLFSERKLTYIFYFLKSSFLLLF